MVLLLAAWPARSQTASPAAPRPPSSGFISFALNTRAFAAPLFGSSTSTTIQLDAGQLFGDGSDWMLALYSGFPLATTLVTIEGNRIPWRGGTATILAGEVQLESPGDRYLLEGASARWRRGNDQWLVYAGRNRYPVVLPGFEESDPKLAGAEYLRRLGSARLGGAVIALADAETAAGRSARLVARADYEYDFSPVAGMFANAYLGDGGATGARAGGRFRSLRSDVTAAIYRFDDDFALVYPLFRPGEAGAEISGSYRMTEFARVYGTLNYLSSAVVLERSNLRGHVGFGYSLGSEGPYFDASYHHDELTHEQLTASRQNVLADRFVLSMTRASLFESLAVRLDHVERREEPDRTQLVTVYGRMVGMTSTADGSLLVQKEESTFGLTAEGGYEQLIRWPYSLRAGVGAAFVRRSPTTSGEGVVQLSVSRRFIGQGTGWYARVEARHSFPIGLERSSLSSDAITFSLGNRIGWNDFAGARSMFTAILSPSSFGAIEGRVTYENKGVAGVPVLVGGQPRAVTSSDGEYRLRRIPAGAVTVSLDASVLEQGYLVTGPAARRVLVAPRAVARADFTIARLVALGGSLVFCAGARPSPVSGARLALVGALFVQTTATSSSGAFEFDAVPPGNYDLVIDPGSVPDIPPTLIPRQRVQLIDDILGYVVPIDCPDIAAPVAPVPQPGPEGSGQPGAVEGAVTVNGYPAEGLAVLVDGQQKARTARGGTFTLTLPAGDHVLSIDLQQEVDPGSRSIGGEANQRVTVRSGENLRVRFALRQEVRFEGRVVVCRGSERQSLSGATLSLLGARHAETITTAGGLFAFPRVPAGQYLMFIDSKAVAESGGPVAAVPRLVIDLRRDVAAYEVEIGCR